MAKFRRPDFLVATGACAVLALAACTGSSDKSSVATQPDAEASNVATADPAPRQCPQLIVRADDISPSELSAALNGHVPAWLPRGFGLAASYGQEGDSGSLAQGQWSDRRCREVSVILYDHAFDPNDGESVGAWAVIADGPGCSNDVLGKARCIVYQSTVDGDGLTVQTIGLQRSDGDRLVSSIP